LKRQRIRRAASHSVGNGGLDRRRHNRTRREREQIRWSACGHHADDFCFQSERIPYRDAPADSGTETNWNVHSVEVGYRAKEFQRVARDAADQDGIEGRNEVQLLLISQSGSMLVRFLKIAAELDEFG